MRPYTVVIILFLCTFKANAQWLTKERIKNKQNFDKDILTFGFYFGVNSFDFDFDYINEQEDIQVGRSAGFNVGFITNLRITEYIDLRTEPGLSFTRRDLQFAPDPRFQRESDLLREVSSTYIYLPLSVRFNTKRLNNVRPFISGGIATTINLSSNEDNPDDNFSGTFRTTTNPFFYELGIGIDLYFPYFKFSPSIKGVFAASDELVRDNQPNSPWTSNLSSIQSRGVFLNFTFQ